MKDDDYWFSISTEDEVVKGDGMVACVKENLDKSGKLFLPHLERNKKSVTDDKSKINKSICFVPIFPSRYLYEYILLKKRIIIIEHLQMDECENNSIPANWRI